MRYSSTTEITALGLTALLGVATCHRVMAEHAPAARSATHRAGYRAYRAIPEAADPCADARYWPLHVRSSAYPAIVHYARADQEAMAREVLALVDRAWSVQVEDIGFSPPLADGGACGDDSAFDIFLWRDLGAAYVDTTDRDVQSTPHDDRSTYMVVDPWSSYGGRILPATIAHEFNHACQGADDWQESPLVFEMTATFIEDVVSDDVDWWQDILGDFQAHPDWALDRDDGYETWYMYGSALYLHFLRETYFDGDARFAAEMWSRSRSPQRAADEPLRNEPDFQDALDALLRSGPGVSFYDSLLDFAYWRYAPSMSLRHSVRVTARVPASPASRTIAIEPAPMMLGSAYVELTPGGADHLRLSLDSSATGVTWAAQVDGQRIDLSSGPATIDMSGASPRVVIITALPAGPYDPDTRTDERFPVAVNLE